MFKIICLALVLLPLPMLVQAKATNNPMRPPAYALEKFQQARDKNKPKVAIAEAKTIKPKALQLTSILYSSSRKVAIIDDRMLSIGDSINGAKVISIKKNSASLNRKGKIINLSLSNQQEIIRKTTAEKKL